MVKSKISCSTIHSILVNLYPVSNSELNFTNEYELVVAVLLSAQCTDKKVNQVTEQLFKKYANFKSLAEANLKEIEELIRPINYFKTKAKNLLQLSFIIMDQHGGRLPKTHIELIKLPGVGNKTANVVLSELGLAETLPVDTHVFRVSKRLGLATSKTVKGVEEELKMKFPPSEWRSLHHRLIFHGRRVCKARNPACDRCELSTSCRYKANNYDLLSKAD